MQYRSNNSKLSLSPLTEENLSKINKDSPQFYNEMISRYCLTSSCNVTSPNNRYDNERYQPSQRSRSTSKDVVVESPRLSPFPYHNDSLFLPTVERSQHGYNSNKRKNGSMSSLSLYSQRTVNSTTTESLAHLPRRAASAPPKYIRPKHLHNNKTSSSLRDEITSKEKSDSSFLSRLFHLFKKKKNSSTKMCLSPSSSTKTTTTTTTHIPTSPSRVSTKSPVWFSQYTLNPPAPNGVVMAAA
ncbi:hypothetical protein BJ944DRAFT_268621 [Cunninghamella echinulata]|nr:hypothetical protein BJ944DRAFT_268621 [Cunninghamella echinulata]